MCIMRTLFAVVLDIFLPNRQCQHHPYVTSSTLYISYHVQLSFCTLSAQMHIVNVIYMLSTHVHIICLSSLPLLIYLIIHNLVSAHCLHTCILLMSSVYCLEMHMLCTCHLYCCYLYMYMSSTYYLGIYYNMCTLSEVGLDIFLPNRQYQCYPYIISSTLYIFYHVQLSFCTLSTQMHIVHVICMFSAHVHIIYLSSLTLLVYPIIHNLVSAHCLHTHPLSVSSVYCLQMHMLCTSHFYCCYLHVICILSENMHIMCTLSAVVLGMFLPNRQCQYHPYIFSSTLYISYHIQLSFCTLSTQTYIVNAIWMLSAHVHIICLSS